MAKAFGNMLKLKDGPERAISWIEIFCCRQKCPKYIKIFNADNIPHTIMLNGIKYKPVRCFYFFGFKLDRFIIPPIARVIWKKTWTIASIHISTANSFEKSGTNKYFKPLMAPSRNKPLIAKIISNPYGINDVNTTILPEVFTPFLTIL